MAQALAGVDRWLVSGDVGISLGSWRWDLATGLVVAERRLAEVFGVDPSEAEKGAPLAVFAEAIDSRDRKEFDRRIRRAIETRQDLHLLYRIPQRFGPALWVVGTGSVVDDNRAFMGTVTLLWDGDSALLDAAASLVITATKIAETLGHRDLVHFLRMALFEMATIGRGSHAG
ncbi:hypothetical protein [Bosea sp. FBZP-16]|jgi:PAS domain-containing protein|uniref:hypothetical protein n=1 Tax=Bosea sp. FBZP-16 TaxID=2065382 RepID=UPI000C30A826|nr:hypothetical protein [Bosea sp. FBZP-16]